MGLIGGEWWTNGNRSWGKEQLPNAVVNFDPFHVIKLMNDKLA